MIRGFAVHLSIPFVSVIAVKLAVANFKVRTVYEEDLQMIPSNVYEDRGNSAETRTIFPPTFNGPLTDL